MSDVDRASDVVRLKTDAGRPTLRASTGATATLGKGDSVIVDVTLIRHADPAGLPRRQEDPLTLFTQRMAGSVAGVQRSLETVALITSAGRLTVSVPADALTSLHTGDTLFVELGVRLEPHVSALPSAATAPRDGGLARLLFFLFGRGK